jgi:hypothetical protein
MAGKVPPVKTSMGNFMFFSTGIVKVGGKMERIRQTFTLCYIKRRMGQIVWEAFSSAVVPCKKKPLFDERLF